MVTVLSVIITIIICKVIVVNGFCGLAIKCIICLIIPLVIECTLFCKKREFKESKILVKNMLKRG